MLQISYGGAALAGFLSPWALLRKGLEAETCPFPGRTYTSAH